MTNELIMLRIMRMVVTVMTVITVSAGCAALSLGLVAFPIPFIAGLIAWHWVTNDPDFPKE